MRVDGYLGSPLGEVLLHGFKKGKIIEETAIYRVCH
jgi:hypothetical protein